MKCLICNKDYIALGVHVKLKHKIDADDYREEFGMLKAESLVDEDLKQHLSNMAKQRIALDPEWKQEITERMLKQRSPNSGRHMGKAGRAKLAARNAANGIKYLENISEKVNEVIINDGTYLDVRRKLGCGRETVIKLTRMGKVNYDLERAKNIRKERGINSRKAAK